MRKLNLVLGASIAALAIVALVKAPTDRPPRTIKAITVSQIQRCSAALDASDAACALSDRSPSDEELLRLCVRKLSVAIEVCDEAVRAAQEDGLTK